MQLWDQFLDQAVSILWRSCNNQSKSTYESYMENTTSIQLTMITPPPLEMQVMQPWNSTLDPWNCDTFGLQIRLNKRSLFIGTQVKKILQTLNIIQLLTTPKSDHIISTWINP